MMKLFLLGLTLIMATHVTAWDYVENAADWSALGVCGTGVEQSPIDLVENAANTNDLTGTVDVLPGEVSVTQLNNGHTIQVNLNNADTVKMTLKDYMGNMNSFYGVQLHFHAPSEHTFQGGQGALEMHIVSAISSAQPANNARSYAVLGFGFEEDNLAADIPFLTAINAKIGQGAGRLLTDSPARFLSTDTDVSDYNLDVSGLFDMVPSNSAFYAYPGSLTTPVCTEAVNWYVNKNVIKVNTAQLAVMKALWQKQSVNGAITSTVQQGNNRPVQSLGSRTVMGGTYVVNSSSSDSDKGPLLTVFVVVAVVLLLVVIALSVSLIKKNHQLEHEEK